MENINVIYFGSVSFDLGEYELREQDLINWQRDIKMCERAHSTGFMSKDKLDESYGKIFCSILNEINKKNYELSVHEFGNYLWERVEKLEKELLKRMEDKE